MINVTRFQLWSAFIVCLLAFCFAAPNFLPEKTAKQIPSYLPRAQFSLGLDLQGGVYLLLEADMKPVIADHLKDIRNQLGQGLREASLGYIELRQGPLAVTFRARNRANVDAAPAQSVIDQAADVARKVMRTTDSASSGLLATSGARYEVRTEGDLVTLRVTEAGVAALNDRILALASEIIRKRVDPTGTREVGIQRTGGTLIIVEVPGVLDPAEIKERLGTTAKMTFHLVHPSISNPSANTPAPAGYKLYPGDRGEQPWVMVNEDVALDGSHLVDAQQTFGQDNRQPVISFRFDTSGARIFCRITRENTGKPFAILLDGKVISAPRINEPICGGSGIISGSFTIESATQLALLLRSGALPVKLNILEERTIGATLGADAIQAGVWTSILGVIMVGVFLITAYGLFGVFAVIALIFNLLILAAVMSLLGATLTLPGIAGIVLSLGLSVDANVLIYERMREERHAGRTTLSAIDAGFRRAFTAIADSNITSIITGILLYLFGSGPVKGFGVTLAIGVGASFFTAVMLTRIQVVFWWRWTRPKQLPI